MLFSEHGVQLLEPTLFTDNSFSWSWIVGDLILLHVTWRYVMDPVRSTDQEISNPQGEQQVDPWWMILESRGVCSCGGGGEWNESGFMPPLCTYRLNWARRTSWGWWDDWDDTVLQTQDSKFEPWRSEAEHATSRSRRLPTILTFTRGWGRNIFVSFKPPRPGTEPRTLAWKAAVLTTTLGPPGGGGRGYGH